MCFCYYLENLLAKEESKDEKIVTAMKKGSAVMDNRLPDHIKAQYHVLQVVSSLRFFSERRKIIEVMYFYLVLTFCSHAVMQGDDIYDAMLNQTNLGQNNNKFFVIQVLGYASTSYHLVIEFMQHWT